MFVVSHETKLMCVRIFCLTVLCLSIKQGEAQIPVNSSTLACFEKNSFEFKPGGSLKDFDFLKHTVAGKRIIMLSEADQGDGTSYQVMSQMMQFLIDSLDFKVVVFDNGNVDVNYFQNKISETENIKNSNKFLRYDFLNSRYGFDIVPFLQTRLKEKKIELFGLDLQVRLDSAVNNLLNETCKIISCNDSIVDRTFVSLLRNLKLFGYKSFLDDPYAKILTGKVDVLIAALNKADQENNKNIQSVTRQWMNIKYLITWLNRRFNFKDEELDLKVTTNYLAARDSVMAENLVWMLNFLYPREKIIVNVSAYHASRFSYKIQDFDECCKAINVKTFGELMSGTTFKDQIYSIVFLSSGGYRGVEHDQIKKLPPPKLNSIEYLFSKTKFDYAFLDLNANKSECNWLSQAFLMAPFFDRYFLGNWADIFNGVVYIREMKPNDYFR